MLFRPAQVAHLLLPLLLANTIAHAQSPLPASSFLTGVSGSYLRLLANDSSPWHLELQVAPQEVETKLHLRLGSATVAGTDVGSHESGTLAYRPAIGLRAALTGPDPVFGGQFTAALGYRYLAFDGEQSLSPRTWGGQTITMLDTKGTFNELDLELRHVLPISSQLTVEVGGALENRIFHANFRTDVGTQSVDLNGSCVAPVVRACYELTPAWSVTAELAGYVVLQVDRDRDRLDDIRRVAASLNWHSGPLTAGFGISQQEADLVQDKDTTMETFVHSRFTSYSLMFGVRF